MFKILEFFDDYGIPYDTKNSYTGKNWASFDCECGSPKLGVYRPTGVAFKCWSCGANPKISEVIRRFAGEAADLKEIFSKYRGTDIVPYYQEEFRRTPKNHQLILPGEKMNEYHKQYLESRGFDSFALEKNFGLLGTTHLSSVDGFEYRIIYPIYYNRKVVSYQGRVYLKRDNRLRWRDCSIDDAVIYHRDILYNLDNATSESVIVVEGLFDLYRLTASGFLGDVVCSFGTSITDIQINILSERYSNVYFLFDPEENALEKARKAAGRLLMMGTNAEVLKIPVEYDDNGYPKDPDEYFRHHQEEMFELRAELGLY